MPILAEKIQRSVGVLLVITLLTLSACSSDDPLSPESAVRATIVALEEAAEKRTLSGFMTHISKGYQDHEGKRWADIQRIVQFEYLRNQNIHILSNITELDVRGDIATVEINAAMAARAADLTNSSQRLRANTHRFSLVLEGSDNQQVWKVKSVAWQRGWH